MPEVRWTEDQLHAIESRGGSLLVSAAAGSGKTAVLVERLIRRIADEGKDITEFLIITYTKAAAGELRRKISDALYKKAAENPGNRHLRRQIALCPSAKISTIHSFLSFVLQTYGERPELSAGFRILDENEGAILKSELLLEVLEEEYAKKEADFLALTENISDARSDKALVAAVLALHAKSMSHPYPVRWMESIKEAYDASEKADISKTIWGEYALKAARERLLYAAVKMQMLCGDVAQNPEAEALYGELLKSEAETFFGLCECSWDELAMYLSLFSFPSLPSSKDLSDKNIAERVKKTRGGVRDEIKKLRESLVNYGSDVLLRQISQSREIVSALCRIAGELDSRYVKEKLSRGVLDYSDLEHMAIELLVSEYDAEKDEVTPSLVGKEISETFTEILLDEFQDSNKIQDIIFRAVSKNEKNLVMVGDVKQSIYGFRLADPSVFMKKYEAFRPYDEAREGEPRFVTLSRNFRSRSEVLTATNSLFSNIMSKRLGGIDYVESEHLVPRENIPEAGKFDRATEFVLLDVEAKGEKHEAEAEFVAKKIEELVEFGYEINDSDGNPKKITYGDCAILLRAASTTGKFFEDALARRGIPFVSARSEGLLARDEVNTMVSLLSVIDNPLSDISLLAVLRSPLFAFTADELCEIRREGKENLYLGVLSLAAKDEPASKKCRAFSELVRELRDLALGLPVDRLIWVIYNRTSALGMFGAMKDGAERQKNLIEFYNCARDFEKAGYRGLYGFVSHLAKIAERGGDIPAPTPRPKNAVTIMTIHKSKGLEFPVVFLGGSIRSFNTKDISEPVLIHPKLGIGLYDYDEDSEDTATLARKVISMAIMEEAKSEEMRVLYVAMTRAREKLYVVAALENAKKRIGDLLEQDTGVVDFREISARNDTLLWYLSPLLKSPQGVPMIEYAGFYPGSRTCSCEGFEVKVIPALEEVEHELIKAPREETVEEASFGFEYPYPEATTAPSKLTATELFAVKSGKTGREKRKPAAPRFIRERELSAAERGTALHSAMQFVNLENCKDEDGVKAELARLLSEKNLTEKQAASIEPRFIAEFANSEIGREIIKAKTVLRELKLSVLLPADELSGNADLSGEEILFQGVIDVCFENDKGVTILDFKTDRNTPSGKTLAQYTEQLRAYRRAFYEMTGKTADRTVLYMVRTGECIYV